MTKTTIDIRRPNGEIETVDVSDKFGMGLTDGMFASVKKATREAGRGDCLCYTNEHIDDRSDADKAWDAVSRAYDNADRLRGRGVVAGTVEADGKADALAADWAAKYPEAAEARKQAAAEHEAEIAAQPGTIAMLEGRD